MTTNESLLREMSIVVAEEEELSAQCMWQHYMLEGTSYETIRSLLMQLAINESLRARIISRTLGCLDLPLFKKPQVCLTEKTENPFDMLRRDRELVDKIIGSYERILLLAQGEESCLLTSTFRELLAQEEAHRAMLGALLASPATGGSPGGRRC
jgi:bacterioferritin (cytochrome b1)